MYDNYKIYIHKLKKDNRVYIGITKQRPKKRWQNGLGYKHSSYFYNAIKKYGWENFEHIILFENLTKEEAENKEKKLIKLYKSNIKGYGFNINEGGSAPTMTEEQKIKISNSEKGKIVSNETKRKISENIKKYYKKYGATENMKKHYQKVIKPIICVETGTIYYGQKKLKELGYNTANINAVCNKKLKTAHGFHWEFYKGDENKCFV